jgi:hypothetical protein
VGRPAGAEARWRPAQREKVQLAGHDYLRGLGLDLVPASAPDFFLDDTPTAVLVRQVSGAISQFEKATLVAKLRAARDRKRMGGKVKVEGRKSILSCGPRSCRWRRNCGASHAARSGHRCRAISAELARRGFVNTKGRPIDPTAISAMLAQR